MTKYFRQFRYGESSYVVDSMVFELCKDCAEVVEEEDVDGFYTLVTYRFETDWHAFMFDYVVGTLSKKVEALANEEADSAVDLYRAREAMQADNELRNAAAKEILDKLRARQ